MSILLDNVSNAVSLAQPWRSPRRTRRSYAKLLKSRLAQPGGAGGAPQAKLLELLLAQGGAATPPLRNPKKDYYRGTPLCAPLPLETLAERLRLDPIGSRPRRPVQSLSFELIDA